MKEATCVLGKALDTQKFGCGAAIKCLIFMLAVLSVLNPAMIPPYGLINEKTSIWPSPVEERQNFNALNSDTSIGDTRYIKKLAAEVQSNDSVLVSDTDTTTMKSIESEKPAEKKSSTESGTTQPSVSLKQGKEEAQSNTEFSTMELSVSSGQKQDLENSNSVSLAQNSGIVCEFSDYRHNVCSIEVNIKVIGSSGNVLLIPPSLTAPANITVWKIRPFTRKWEEATTSRVKELMIQWVSDQNQGPACDVTHDVPVLMFATAGFPFNPFHSYTDLLIPLFVAANQYNGEVQFAVTNCNWPWINKYLSFIQALSHYPIINLDSETAVHCFPSGQVGLRGTNPLNVDMSTTQNGYTTQDFRNFVRTSLSLERAQVEIVDKRSNKRPKIAILLRKGTRAFTNENEIVEMAEGVGFEVIRLDTETTKDFPKVAHLINSCDALMGLHGAGLTNMIYLPNNATVIQIIPLGNLSFISWKDYGEPTKDMGLTYVEYEIKTEESTLIEKYPRSHTVFTNPQELHKQGWEAMYTVYLVEQSVKLDVNRFRGVLVDLFNSLTRQKRRNRGA